MGIVQVVLLFERSFAMRVMTVLAVMVVPAAGVWAMVTGPQASVAFTNATTSGTAVLQLTFTYAYKGPAGHMMVGGVMSCGVMMSSLLATELQPADSAFSFTLVVAVSAVKVAEVTFVAKAVDVTHPSVLFIQVSVPNVVPEVVSVTLPPGHTVVALAEIVPGEGTASTFSVCVVLRAQVPDPTVYVSGMAPAAVGDQLVPLIPLPDHAPVG